MVSSGQQPLGQLLVEMGFIDQTQLKSALEAQGRSGKRLGKILIDAGVISEDRLVHALSRQLGIEACDPIMTPVHERVLALVPPEMAFRHKVLPIARQREDSGECLYVATSDPLDKRALQAIRTVIPPTTRVRWMLAGETEMELALARHYRPGTPSDRGATSRETIRGAPVPSGIPVLQGKPLAAPRGSAPVAPATSGPPNAGANVAGLHAHSSTGDIFNALEQAVLRSGEAPRQRPMAAPSMPPAILKSTGDLAIADPSRWTGGDLSPPEPPHELEPIRLGTKDLAPEAPGSFDLPLDLTSEDMEPPPPMELTPVAAVPDPLAFFDGSEASPESLTFADELLPPARNVQSQEPILADEEVVDGEPLGESADLPLLTPAPMPAARGWSPPPMLSAPPQPEPHRESPPLSKSAPAYPSPGPATTPERSSSAPFVAAPPPTSSSSPSTGSLPAFGLSAGSSWGDLLDDPNPHSSSAPVAANPPPFVDDPEVAAIEELPSSAGPETDRELEALAQAPFLEDPVRLLDPLPEVSAADVEALDSEPSAPPFQPEAGEYGDGAGEFLHRPIDLPERSALLDTGEEVPAEPAAPLQLADADGASMRLTPVADFLRMAEVAGVSGLPTTIPESAPLEESVEFGGPAEGPEASGDLSALGPPEDLPDASEDVEIAEDPELQGTDEVTMRPPTTADLLVGPAKSTVARDLLLRFIADEDQTQETQRYVLRLLASVLLAEGLLDDDRLNDALERLR
jgi:hypothetical protein